MTDLPAPNDLVLVAFMPSPADLDIARLLGWYRIPLKTAPRVVAVDYLAFYQPATFGEGHKWCVEFVAPVKGHELLTRRELMRDEAEHPRSGEEYFKLQLGSLRALPHPIPARKWKRLTFLYTTGERLSAAETIDELSVHDEERQVLWRALRERARAAEQYGVEDLPEMAVDPEVLGLFAMGALESEASDDAAD